MKTPLRPRAGLNPGSLLAPIAAALLVGVLGLWPTAATAQECDEAARSEATLLDSQASAKFERADYRPALERWQKAWKLCPNHITAWNIARSHEQLKELFEAREFFMLCKDRFTLSEDWRGLVEEKLETLNKDIEIWRAKDEEAAQLFASEKYDASLKASEEAYAINKTIATAERMMRCHWAMGNIQAAMEVLRTAILIGRDLSEPERRRAERQLEELKQALLDAKKLEEDKDKAPVNPNAPAFKIAGFSSAGLGALAFVSAGLLIATNQDKRDEIASIDAEIRTGEVSRVARRELLAEDLNEVDSLLVVAYSVGSLSLVAAAALLTLGYYDGEAPEDPAAETEAVSGVEFYIGPSSVGVMGRF